MSSYSGAGPRPAAGSQPASGPRGCPTLIALIALAMVAFAAEPRYLKPIELVVSPDGARLYVVCEGSDELAVVQVQSGMVVSRVAVGKVPKGIALSPDGATIFVANSWSDTVSAID